MDYQISPGQKKITDNDRFRINRRGYTSVSIPDSITEIGNGAFYGCESLATVTLPTSIQAIGATAFAGCTELNEITLPNSVKSIGRSAFSGCANLRAIQIPDGVTEINSACFEYCAKLTTVQLPASLRTIGDSVFRDCLLLTDIIFSSQISRIGKLVFQNCAIDLNTIFPSIYQAIDQTLESDLDPQGKAAFINEYLSCLPDDPTEQLPNLSNFLKEYIFVTSSDILNDSTKRIFLKFSKTYITNQNMDDFLELAHISNATDVTMRLLDVSRRVADSDLSDLTL